MWTAERKRRAALMAPVGSLLRRPDSEFVEREGWYQIITPSTNSMSANQIVLSDIGDDDADARIEDVFARYRAHRLPFKWAVYPWSRPVDLGARLGARGMAHEEARAMVAPTSLHVDAPPEITTERIAPATIDTFMDAMERGWEMHAEETRFYRDEFLRLLRVPMRPPQLFVARLDGAPAATGATLLKDDGSGFLVGAVVLSACRGRGLYRALLKCRAEALLEGGYELMTTHAIAATSAPMLEHFGFETVFRYAIYQYDPDSP